MSAGPIAIPTVLLIDGNADLLELERRLLEARRRARPDEPRWSRSLSGLRERRGTLQLQQALTQMAASAR